MSMMNHRFRPLSPLFNLYGRLALLQQAKKCKRGTILRPDLSAAVIQLVELLLTLVN